MEVEYRRVRDAERFYYCYFVDSDWDEKEILMEEERELLSSQMMSDDL